MSRFAIAVGRFYEDLAQRLIAGAQAGFAEGGAGEADVFDVPGAFELPLAASYLAGAGYEGVACLGAVIRGETDHYDFVCGEAARGIQDVQLRTGVPCAFGVLTVENMDQALARTGGGKRDQGRHAAEAVLAMAAMKAPLSQAWLGASLRPVSKEVAALLLTALVHVLGAGVLIWAMLDGQRLDWRSFWPRDDGDDGGGGGPDAPRGPGAPPLPDAVPARVRMREPGRLADLRPKRDRQHPPVPARAAPALGLVLAPSSPFALPGFDGATPACSWAVRSSSSTVPRWLSLTWRRSSRSGIASAGRPASRSALPRLKSA